MVGGGGWRRQSRICWMHNISIVAQSPEKESHIHVAVRVVLGHNLVDPPFAHVQNLDIDRVVPDELLDPRYALLMRGTELIYAQVRSWPRHHNKHPLLPRLDHPHQAGPAPRRVVFLRCEHPVQVTRPVRNEVRHVRLDQHVERKALAGLLFQRDVQLPHNL